MSFFEGLKAAWWAFRVTLQTKQSWRLIATWARGIPRYPVHSYDNFADEGYRKNEIVYACIRKIAQSASEPTLRVYDLSDGEELPDHALRQLIRHPNPYFSEFEFWEATLILLNIAGNVYWEKVRSGAGRVVELWPLRPDRVQILPGDEKLIGGYRYTVLGIPMDLRAEDVIHFSYYDPLDDFFGLSPIAVAARAADVDNAVTDYTKLFFENAATPYGLLKTKQKLTEAEAQRIRERWKEQYAGPGRWHEVAVLDADAEYQRLGLTQDEMGFPDLRNISESRLCMIFNVPPILLGTQLGLERSTFANYAESRASFWSDTLSPIYKRLADKVNAELAPEFGQGVEARWDFSEVKALQEDTNEVWKRATDALRAGGIMVNDFRREVGMDPVDGWDVFLLPLSIQVMQAPTSPPSVPPKPGEEAGQKAAGLPQAKDFEVSGAALQTLIDRVARAWEGRITEAARGEFEGERDGVLAILQGTKARKQSIPWLDIISAVDAFIAGQAATWRANLLPLFRAAAEEAGQEVANFFGLDPRLGEVMRFIEDYGFKFTDKVSSVSREEVAGVLQRAMEEGWGIPETTQALQELYDGWSKTRATLIARTESIRISNAAAVAVYRYSGVVRKQWWTAMDERTCPACRDMHGTILDVDTAFAYLGDVLIYTDEEGRERSMQITYEDVQGPPLHPDCRCTVLPVVIS